MDAGHVFRRGRLRFLFSQFRQTEIKYLRQAVIAQHDVFGFDVAVNNSGVVCGVERRGNLQADIQRFTLRQRSAS